MTPSQHARFVARAAADAHVNGGIRRFTPEQSRFREDCYIKLALHGRGKVTTQQRDYQVTAKAIEDRRRQKLANIKAALTGWKTLGELSDATGYSKEAIRRVMGQKDNAAQFTYQRRNSKPWLYSLVEPEFPLLG